MQFCLDDLPYSTGKLKGYMNLHIIADRVRLRCESDLIYLQDTWVAAKILSAPTTYTKKTHFKYETSVIEPQSCALVHRGAFFLRPPADQLSLHTHTRICGRHEQNKC